MNAAPRRPEQVALARQRGRDARERAKHARQGADPRNRRENRSDLNSPPDYNEESPLAADDDTGVWALGLAVDGIGDVRTAAKVLLHANLFRQVT